MQQSDQELLSAYLDGECTPDEVIRVEALLSAENAEGDIAREFMDELRALTQIVRAAEFSMPAPLMPHDFAQRFKQQVDREVANAAAKTPAKRAKGRILSLRRVWYSTAALAVVALGLSVSWKGLGGFGFGHTESPDLATRDSAAHESAGRDSSVEEASNNSFDASEPSPSMEEKSAADLVHMSPSAASDAATESKPTRAGAVERPADSAGEAPLEDAPRAVNATRLSDAGLALTRRNLAANPRTELALCVSSSTLTSGEVFEAIYSEISRLPAPAPAGEDPVAGRRNERSRTQDGASLSLAEVRDFGDYVEYEVEVAVEDYAQTVELLARMQSSGSVQVQLLTSGADCEVSAEDERLGSAQRLRKGQPSDKEDGEWGDVPEADQPKKEADSPSEDKHNAKPEKESTPSSDPNAQRDQSADAESLADVERLLQHFRRASPKSENRFGAGSGGGAAPNAPRENLKAEESDRDREEGAKSGATRPHELSDGDETPAPQTPAEPKAEEESEGEGSAGDASEGAPADDAAKKPELQGADKRVDRDVKSRGAAAPRGKVAESEDRELAKDDPDAGSAPPSSTSREENPRALRLVLRIKRAPSEE